MDLLELLTKGDVDAFNTQRGDRTRLEFFAADLPGLSLVGVDLSGANLDKSDLTGTDLSEASLYKTSMTGVDGAGMKLVGALAARLRLKEAYLDEADLSDAELSHGDFKEAVLTGSRGDGVHLGGARLTEVDASGCAWPRADLVEAQLYKANFEGADLSGADLTDARGDEVNFKGARLDACTATRLRAASGCFVGASLVGARLDGAHLAGADFTDADLSAADLSGANLVGANLTGATLRGAVLADAALDGVDLSGLDLEDVDLRGVDPNAVGLSEDQIESLAGVGAHVDPDAPVAVRDPAVSRAHGAVAALWLNADSETHTSLRWALIPEKGAPCVGVLPTSPEGVVARLVTPTADGFALLLVVERTGGTVLVVYPLGRDGAVGASVAHPLGYQPAVNPVVRADADGALLWGVARRGPTLVVHRLGDAQPTPLHSELVATARGFLGDHHPVLVCKGGVVMALSPEGASPPVRAPEGFPSRLAQAAPFEDRVLGVWFEESLDDDEPGGLRAAWMAKRGVPVVESIVPVAAVAALDVLPVPEGVWVAWIEERARGVEVRVTLLPGDDGIHTLPLDAGVEPVALRFVPGRFGAPDPAPAVALWTADGALYVTDVDGRPLGHLDPDAC